MALQRVGHDWATFTFIIHSNWINLLNMKLNMGFSGSWDGRESNCNVGDLALIPGLGRSPGEVNSYPLQYSCLENSMDRGAWQAIVHGVRRVRQDWAANTFTFTWTNMRVHLSEIKILAPVSRMPLSWWRFCIRTISVPELFIWHGKTVPWYTFSTCLLRFAMAGYYDLLKDLRTNVKW